MEKCERQRIKNRADEGSFSAVTLFHSPLLAWVSRSSTSRNGLLLKMDIN